MVLTNNEKEITVIFPFEEPRNPYIEEMGMSFRGAFVFSSITNNHTDYDIIHIHWPEALFRWTEPSRDEIDELHKILDRCSRHLKIIYTRHNEFPHSGKSKNFDALYSMIEDISNGIIHLGQYSYNQYKNRSHIKQIVIPHPLFSRYPNEISKQDARRRLGIQNDDIVILCLGTLRNWGETNFLRRVFKMIKIKSKKLIVPSMSYYLSDKHYRGISSIYANMRRVIDNLNPKIDVGSGFVPNNNLQVYLNASDVLFIPRQRSLNSGLLLLGISFGIPVVCSFTGNNTEVIHESNSYGYTPGNIESAAQAIQDALDLSKGPVPASFLESRRPKRISELYYKFCLDILDE